MRAALRGRRRLLVYASAGLVCAVALAALIIVVLKLGPGHAGTPIVSSGVLKTPIRVSVAELDRMLHVYTMFVAIGHDRELASEASMTTTRIEVSGLPTGLNRPGLLALFPAARWALQSMAPHPFTLLDRPEAALFKSGIFVDPAGARVILLTGRTYTQDGYGGIASYLEGASQGVVTLRVRFFPGDYADPGDLNRFELTMSGTLSLDGLAVTRVGGRLKALSALSALREAAGLFATFEEAPLDQFRFTARDEREAREVERLAQQVAPGEMRDMRREGTTFIVARRPSDLGLLIAYVRYGKSVLEQ
jgi:hypothetical protein